MAETAEEDDSPTGPAWSKENTAAIAPYTPSMPSFGVDTSGLIYELPSGHQHDAHNNGYFGVAPSVFHAVMDALRERLASGFSALHVRGCRFG